MKTQSIYTGKAPESASVRLGFSVSQKFALALTLFLAPLFFVTFQLAEEQQKAIEFANRERVGLQYLEAVTGAELQLREFGRLGGAGSSHPNQIEMAIEGIRSAQDGHGAALEVGLNFSTALARLGEISQRSATDPSSLIVAERALAALRREVGDKSNLILDPDLDSYYSMDALVTKLPAAQSALRALAAAAQETLAEGGFSTRDQSKIAASVTAFESARADLDFSMDAGFRGARDARLRENVEPLQSRSRSRGAEFVAEVEGAAIAPLRGRISQRQAEAAATVSLSAMSDSVSDELDRLLRERVERFQNERLANFLVAIALFAAALAATIIMLRQGIVRPIALLTSAIGDLAAGAYGRVVPLQERRDEVGEIARALEVLRGVARAKIEVDAARLAAESANKAKSQFIANMSHELRTPLNAIIGYTELVLEEMEANETNLQGVADLRRVTASATHLLALINDILNLAKIESGRDEADLSTFDLKRVVEEVMSVSAPIAKKTKTSLVWLDGEEFGLVHSDPRRLKQCLLNLVSNACKFTHAGRVEVSARREMHNAGALLVFRVKDNGIGMSAEQVAQLFRPFQQADSSISGRYGGTGLGLSITRELARMLGGDAWLESVLGAGTTAFLSVRLDQTGADEKLAGGGESDLAGRPLLARRA